MSDIKLACDVAEQIKTICDKHGNNPGELINILHEGKKVSELRATYPPYFIAKNRVDLTPEIDVDAILAKVKEIYKNEEINDIDNQVISTPNTSTETDTSSITSGVITLISSGS